MAQLTLCYVNMLMFLVRVDQNKKSYIPESFRRAGDRLNSFLVRMTIQEC